MKFSNFLRRSLAMLVLLATFLSLVPNVFAARDDIDNIVIDIPDYLEDEDIVTASFGEDGKIVYDIASEEIRAAINAGGMTTSAITDTSGTTILENRGNPAMAKQQRLAFFIDPSNSEGTSNYVTFSLTAARVQTLVAAGVTDLFVMTKNRAGTFSLTDLKTANSNKGSAKVYAWMHCARDDAYLASNKNSAQYHFRAGYNNSQNGGDTSVSGYVHLANSGYVTYMKGLMEQANDFADGLLLDSLIFGTEYMGWDADARTYMGKTYYNEAVKAMCARAYEQYGSTYRYKADANGYYAYVASGGSTNTSGSTLSEISSTDAGIKFRDYRRSVINTFIKEMRSTFGTSKIIAVALERDYSHNFFNHTVRGLYPYGFRSYINNGFVVTMQVGANHTTNPVTLAKTMAKYTNVMVGVDFYKVGTVGTYGYTYPDTVTDLAESLFTARYQVAGDYATYRGYILGAACYTMGHVGAVKVSLSGSGTTPTMTATVANPNKKTVAMLTYFNKHGDTDCTPNTAYGTDTVLSGTMHYYAQSGYVTSYTPLGNYTVSAFGGSTLQVKLKNYTVDWDKLPFIRFGYYPVYDFDSYANTVAHFPIYIIANHASCTSFTTTWISAAATCTTKGFKKHVCKTCGFTYIEEVAKTAHTETSAVTTQPTCDTTGIRTYTCSVCNATRTETVAALGHDYQATVTPPTCLEGGYTTYVCSRDASHTYVADQTPATGHTFVGGVCKDCGFSLATLIHFKKNAEENTWDWQIIGGSGLGFDTTTDGAMYATTNGMIQSYFYIEPSGIGNIDHKLVAGDVIQIRMRVRTAQSSATTAVPSVSLDLNTTSAYGDTLTGNSIDLSTTEWQLVTIPITGYAADNRIEKVRIDPFGETLVAGYVEIDYIHFGSPEAVPITIMFYNDNGKLLQKSMIPAGTNAEYYGETPTKRSSAGFTYTFSGWKTSDGQTVTDLTAVTFAKDTVLTAQYTYERGNVEPLDSNKNLIDNDGNLEDYKYDIEIDASTYGQMVTINKEYKKPLDITIVMDRSTSTCFPADESNTSMTWTVTNNTTSLTNVLNKLDKTKPEGYYTATNWLGVDYVGPTDEQAGGYISYEDMKWDGTKWMVWQTLELYDEAPTKYTTALKAIYTDGAYELVRPASVLYKYSNYTYHHTTFGKWVPLATAYTDFFARCQDSFDDAWETSHGLSGYNEANMKFKIAVSRRGMMQDALTKFVDSIYESTSQLPQGQYHRISIVSYGYQAYVKDNTFTFTNAAGSTGTYTCSTDPGVTITPVTLNSAANVTTVKNVINKPFAFGATSTDQGLKFAAEHQTTMRNSANTSQGVVILFTDGAPTYGDGFFINTANNALTQANSMKNNGTTIFAVGYMDGLDSTGTLKAWSDSNSIGDQANTFLHYVSSNYPSPTSMTVPGSGNAKAGYYMSDTTGLNLANVFGSIYTITDTTTKADTQITGPLVIKDIITREWDVVKENGGLDIKVERCDYLGLGEFAQGAAIDNTNNSIYTLTTAPLTDSTGAYTGETEVKVVWNDAPNAWLREAEEATNGYMGYKLLVTIGIELDRESTIGGNNIPTNSPESGIFYPTNSDLDHKYDIPNVNVVLEYDYNIHDYFLDLEQAHLHDDSVATVNDALYFDFKNTGTDAVRYQGAHYERRNYDQAESWAYNPLNTSAPIISTANEGTLIIQNTVAGKSHYAQTSSSTKRNDLSTTPLEYTLKSGDVIKMRVRTEHMVAASGQTPNATLYYGKNNDSAISAYLTDYSNANLVSGNYVDITATVPANLVGTLISALRPQFTNMVDDGTGKGKILIDYIFVGSEAEFATRFESNFDLITVDTQDLDLEFTSDVYSSLYSRKVDIDGLNNRWVNIEHFAGTDIYSEYLEAGTTTWGPSFNTPDFVKTTDQKEIPVGYTVTPLTFEIDSLGREPFPIKNPVQNGKTNYYSPKFMVIDFETTAIIPMQKETEAQLGTPVVVDENGTLDPTTSDLKYNFRNNFLDDAEQVHIMRGIETIGYTVNPINDPRLSNSETIARIAHLIPATTVEYDYDVLTPYVYDAKSNGYTGKWDDVGSHDSTKQNCNNLEIHGHDSALLNSTSEYPYSFGRTLSTTVKANVRDESGNIVEYHNNDALTFSFIGTGFDVISQTGPNEGYMFVEVYYAGTKELVQRYVVDNYLKDTTLYQIPVVHCMDLEYDSYDVVIRAYYSPAFSHYKSADKATGGVMTEEALREILGLSADEPLNFTPSPDRGRATRALTADSYDVSVDGVRIYNTLGDYLEPETHAVGCYTYDLAGETNVQFINAHSVIVGSNNWKYDIPNGEKLNGMLYIAAGGTESSSSEMDTGLHLSSSGIYNYEIVNGTKYLVDRDGKRVTHPTHKTDIYAKIDIYGTCTYHCMSSTGAEVKMTGSEVGQIIGSGKIVYYNSNYKVNSPKNEIYLSGSNGVAFNIEGATSAKISAKSIDGSAVALQVYDWTDGEFVTVDGFSSTSKNGEMYYNIHSYTDATGKVHSFLSDSGDVVLRNLNDATHTGVISLCNVKVTDATVSLPSKAYKAVDLIVTPVEKTDCEHAALTFGEAKAPTCVDEGNIEFWYCDDCECFFSDAEATEQISGLSTILAPTGIHSFENGSCTICGEAQPVEDAEIFVESLSGTPAVTLGASISFAYSIPGGLVSEYTRFYLIIEKDVAGSDPITVAYEVGDMQTIYNPSTGEAIVHNAVFNGINAKEMGDLFTVTIYGEDAEGNTYYGPSYTTSIKDCLMERILSDKSTAEQKTMAVDMLNYGAAAQLYFEYNTDALVNEDLTAEQAALGTQTFPEAIDRSNATGEGIVLNTNVVLANKVTLYVTAMHEVAENAELKFVVKDAASGKILSEIVPEEVFDGFLRASYDNVGAKQMRQLLTIELYENGELISQSITWSVESFVAQRRIDEKIPELQRDMINAMLVYGDSVAAFMNAQ